MALWVNTLWDSVKNFFVAGFESVWSGFHNMLRGSLTALAEDPILGVLQKTEQEWRDSLQYFVSLGLIDEEAVENLATFAQRDTFTNQFMWMFTMYSLNTQYLQNFSFASTAEMRRTLNTQFQPTDPNPYDILQAGFIAPEKVDDIRQILLEAGYSEEKIDLMFLSYYKLYNEDILRVLFLRGEIDDDHLFLRMREMGYTDTRTREIIKTWGLIPPVQDLVSFASRSLFNPETIQTWPWMFETPEGFGEWVEKQGLSRDWASYYWAAHWVQPGLRETFEMLHRKVIPPDDVLYALEARGFSEYWQEKLFEISYQPYTRVDVRRMHDLNILNDEQLQTAYEDLGYDAEHAAAMTAFTVRYNQQTGRDLTRSQIVQSFLDHLIDRNEAQTLLQNLDYSRDEADFILEYYDFQKQKDYEDKLIKNIGDRFKNNLITREQAEDSLNSLNLEGVRIRIILDEWNIDKYEDRKLPSKTDLNKFFLKDIIDEDRYRQEMRKLGYDRVYAEWYIKLSKQNKGQS